LSTDGSRLSLESFVGLPGGGAWIRDRVEGDAVTPSELGTSAAERLLSAGAAELLGETERDLAAGRRGAGRRKP